MVLAKELGRNALTDHQDLYDPRYDIHLIIVLTPDQAVFENILQTRPDHIRIQSFDVFSCSGKPSPAKKANCAPETWKPKPY